MNQQQRQLIFENGRSFIGEGFGAGSDSVAEVVFSTSMVGYQEIISDPSCRAQMICMTYPLIGNYGLADEDYESRFLHLSGLIVREYNDLPSNYRYTKTLGELMAESGVPGIAGVDTRQITRMIRDEGSMRALLTDVGCSVEEGLARLCATPVPHDQVASVSCKKLWYSRTANYRYNVVAVDCGIKHGIIRRLNQKGCNVTVVPYNTSVETVRSLRPDGLFFSNGPGDPMDVPETTALMQGMMGTLPIFGICLGHLLLALACGASTYKMKFGHRGGNHPVKNLDKSSVEMTSQNHSYAVDTQSLANTALRLTHINLLDNTAEGLRSDGLRAFSVQYHPESAPGPQDSDYLFDHFIALMEAGRTEGGACYA